MGKKKNHHQGSWLDGRRDESITEEDALRLLRVGIVQALEDKNADVAKTLAEAHEFLAGTTHRNVGF